MSDLISKTELLNRLARVPISQYAVDERTAIYNVINEMEPVPIGYDIGELMRAYRASQEQERKDSEADK